MADTDYLTKPGHSRKRSIDIPVRPAFRRKSIAERPSLLGSSRNVAQEVVKPPKPDMTTSFLQYCAMCEKQITTPCNSILYCSEACRRKDSNKPLSAAIMTQTTPPSSMPSSPVRPILTPRTPTGTYTDLSSVRIPSDLHDHKSDLDPTEWKPKLPQRKHSEAFRFLSQFHRSTSSMSISDTNSMNNDGMIIDVPSASMPTPSLVNTPTTTASSLGTSAGYKSGYGGYDFNTRPLPTRHNRWYSAGGATPRGTDLVTPHVAPPVIIDESVVEGHEDLWGKKAIFRGGPSFKSQEGLGRLFSSDA